MVQARQRVLDIAYTQHPERFVRQAPTAPQQPEAVWINPPARDTTKEDSTEPDKTPRIMLP